MQTRRSTTDAWRGLLSWGAAIGTVAAVVILVPGVAPASLRDLVGLGPTALGTPPVVPQGGAYAFLHHQKGDPSTPVTWDPCRRIEYVVNPTGAGTGEVELVHRAVAEVSRASGLQFEYAGTTDRRPAGRGKLSSSRLDDPVLISWATAAEVDHLEGVVAGVAGAVPRRDMDGVLRYRTGGVTFDIDSFTMLASRPDGLAARRAIALHELGHLLGLDHVDSPAELMHEDNVGLHEFALGDINGLARLGSGTCL